MKHKVKRVHFETALRAATTHEDDFRLPYIRDLIHVIDLEAIRSAGVRIGVDPLGGSSVHYWQPIAETYGLNIEVVNQTVDPTFRFLTRDVTERGLADRDRRHSKQKETNGDGDRNNAHGCAGVIGPRAAKP